LNSQFVHARENEKIDLLLAMVASIVEGAVPAFVEAEQDLGADGTPLRTTTKTPP
jgi:hypothetical protein